MLQRVETEVGHVGGFGMTEDPEDAAFVLEFVSHLFLTRGGPAPPPAAARSRSRRSFGTAIRLVDVRSAGRGGSGDTPDEVLLQRRAPHTLRLVDGHLHRCLPGH